MTRLRLGSTEHRDLFCDSFVASHIHYDPERLPWPELDPDVLERLQGIPFWGEALATETETGEKITAYATRVADPVLQRALALQGREEMRHAALLATLIRTYAITAVPRRVLPLPDDLEVAFVDAGYGECIDSFFAFGLFAIAGRSGFFPAPLLAVMEPIVAEEARHIVFFANWEAYRGVQRRRGALILRGLRSLRYYVRAVRRRLGVFRNAGGSGFTAGGAASVVRDLTPASFLETCLAENARRLAAFDPGLLRPRLMPALARGVLRSLRGVPAYARQHRKGGDVR
ncbi:MAG TPA: ferritin-like domain-containing protein [Candidatus Bathyarchaeia archaeon]|nr:ferritin-like domain-containing protein [Candidatus Bathyarchaeia archaeon]